MDITTLIIIIAVVAIVLFLLNRNRMASGNPYYNNSPTNDPYARGAESPTYDDPNYTSAGSIGGAPMPEPPRERSLGESGGGRHDDPNYRSGGSIGG